MEASDCRMNVLDSCWSDPVTSPDPHDWAGLLTKQQPFAVDSSAAALRTSARQRLVEAAQQFSLRLHEIAGRAEIRVPSDPVLTGDPQTQPLIMTGHQPVPFHGGLTFKYYCTEQVAAERQAIATAVIIDTDEGDPGAFRYPQIDPDVAEAQTTQLTQRTGSLCRSSGLLGFVPLRPAEELARELETIAAHLEGSAGPEAAAALRAVAEDYVRLARAGATAAEAGLIVRRSHGIGNRLLEIPLSAICCFPEVLQFTAEILSESPRFARAYNQRLAAFRKSHGISNQANPFPDLQLDSELAELPFWVLDSSRGTRQKLFVRSVDGAVRLQFGDAAEATAAGQNTRELLDELLLRGLQLIPRGALITAFLRLLFADLFVHGTGGGHYDAFTTEFIRDWWGVEATPVAVASASRYLLADRRTEIERLQALNQDLRDLRYNPQRYFGQDVFAADVENRLKKLADRKEKVVAALKTAREEGRSAKDSGHEIQLISDEMRSVVDDAFSSQLAALNELTPQTESAASCRTYPWFLFPTSE